MKLSIEISIESIEFLANASKRVSNEFPNFLDLYTTKF